MAARIVERRSIKAHDGRALRPPFNWLSEARGCQINYDYVAARFQVWSGAMLARAPRISIADGDPPIGSRILGFSQFITKERGGNVSQGTLACMLLMYRIFAGGIDFAGTNNRGCAGVRATNRSGLGRGSRYCAKDPTERTSRTYHD